LLSHKTNIIGSGSGETFTEINNYREVRYENLWNGIDLTYSFTEKGLKYEFMVDPGYDPGNIKVCPDYTQMDPEKWWEEYQIRKNPIDLPKDVEEWETERQDREMDEEDFRETKSYGTINHGDALWDGMIKWFRK
jgi:hypothetical protein